MHPEREKDKWAVNSHGAFDVDAVIKTVGEIQRKWSGKINTDGSLKPEGIRALLKLEGVDLKALAERNGFVDPWLHRVINRECPDPRVRRLIAEAIGIPYECIWGEVVNAD